MKETKKENMRTAEEFTKARKAFIEQQAEAAANNVLNVVEKSLEYTSEHPVEFYKTGKVSVNDTEKVLERLEEMMVHLLGDGTSLYKEVSEKAEEIVNQKLKELGWKIDESADEGCIIPIESAAE